MPAFAYKAADKTGAAKKGIIEASSPAAARALLREQSLLPLSVEAASTREKAFGFELPQFRRGIKPRQLATVTRQIATLVGSDIAIEQITRGTPTANSKGVRFGNLTQVRAVVDEEFEALLAGSKTAQQALDTAVERGNQILRDFEAANQ